MKILLVEPDYKISVRKRVIDEDSNPLDDQSLLYPPLGLLKLATYHRSKGDSVHFVRGCDKNLFPQQDFFENSTLWDRVYITTLFTYDYEKTIKTIRFYVDAVGGSRHKVFVGGVMASLMADEIFKDSGISPIVGLLNQENTLAMEKLEINEQIDIDSLDPDYSVLNPKLYAINNTFYGYTTRGCKNSCEWCGVPSIEPKYDEYIDIKPYIKKLREKYGDYSRLKLMDNNVLASPRLERIINDLTELGYGKNQYTETKPKRLRVVDFNQGLDSKLFNDKRGKLLSTINIKPMRIAFDRLDELKSYEKALEIAVKYGFRDFSNYMLFNCNDTPLDLYERLMVNIQLNRKWQITYDENPPKIFSYPMRFAPINDKNASGENKRRDYIDLKPVTLDEIRNGSRWNRKFVRNIEVMRGAAHGAISPTVSLAIRTIGENYDDFIANLYMPEIILRNRNKYEMRVWEHEPQRKPGNGDIEKFREFIKKLRENPSEEFVRFHDVISSNSIVYIRDRIYEFESDKIKGWLKYYTVK